MAELTLGLNPLQTKNNNTNSIVSVNPKIIIQCSVNPDKSDAAAQQRYGCSTTYVMNKLEIDRVQDYLKSLEEERRKIEGFKRELPICMQLLCAAIETSKEQLSNYQTNQFQQKTEDSPSRNCCSDQQKLASLIDKSTDHDKFLSLTRSTQVINDHQHTEASITNLGCSSKSVSGTIAIKLHEETEGHPLITSATAEQRNQDAEVMQSPYTKFTRPTKRRAIMCFSEDANDSNEYPTTTTTDLDLRSLDQPKGAFLPFNSTIASANPSCGRSFPEEELEGVGNDGNISPSSNGTEDRSRSGDDHSGTVSTSSGNDGTKEVVQNNSTANNAGIGVQSSHIGSQRKQRRCWSPGLHKKFVNALQQLGGSEVATPKMIREVMQVDGLTNDEVKSHLQKYRLHTRGRTNPSFQANGGQTDAAPQLVLLGGIWMPPEYNPVLNQSPDSLYKLNSGHLDAKLVNNHHHQTELVHKRELKPASTNVGEYTKKSLHQFNHHFQDHGDVTPRPLPRSNSTSTSTTYDPAEYNNLQHQNEGNEPSPIDTSENIINQNTISNNSNKCSCKDILRDVCNCNITSTNHVGHRFGSQQFFEDLQRQQMDVSDLYTPRGKQKDVSDLYTPRILAPVRSKWRYNSTNRYNVIQGDFSTDVHGLSIIKGSL